MSSGPADSAKGRVRGALKSFGFIVWVVVFQISCHSLFHAFFTFLLRALQGGNPKCSYTRRTRLSSHFTGALQCSSDRRDCVNTWIKHGAQCFSYLQAHCNTYTGAKCPFVMFFFPLSVFQRAHCRLTNAELQTNITLNVSKGPSPAPHRFLSPAKVCFFFSAFTLDCNIIPRVIEPARWGVYLQYEHS